MGRVRVGLCAAIAVGLVSVLGVFVATRDSSADLETKAIVKLYSGGVLLNEWKASGPGRMEGDSFVFPTRRGVRELTVRIRGVFSVEETE